MTAAKTKTNKNNKAKFKKLREPLILPAEMKDLNATIALTADTIATAADIIVMAATETTEAAIIATDKADLTEITKAADMAEAAKRAWAAVKCYLTEGPERTMSRFNSGGEKSPERS